MRFIDRADEMRRLDAALVQPGAFTVIWGRRRVGKTRLLIEWSRRHDGLYAAADPSAPTVQRRYLAAAVERRFPGFGDVEYPDWRSFLQRLAREADRTGWRKPFVLDELPYLIASDSTLPGVLQAWVDRGARLGCALSVLGWDAALLGARGAVRPRHRERRRHADARPGRPSAPGAGPTAPGGGPAGDRAPPLAGRDRRRRAAGERDRRPARPARLQSGAAAGGAHGDGLGAPGDAVRELFPLRQAESVPDRRSVPASMVPGGRAGAGGSGAGAARDAAGV